jgi:hypothetical protein
MACAKRSAESKVRGEDKEEGGKGGGSKRVQEMGRTVRRRKEKKRKKTDQDPHLVLQVVDVPGDVAHQIQIPRLVEAVVQCVVRNVAEHGHHFLAGLAWGGRE